MLINIFSSNFWFRRSLEIHHLLRERPMYCPANCMQWLKCINETKRLHPSTSCSSLENLSSASELPKQLSSFCTQCTITGCRNGLSYSFWSLAMSVFGVLLLLLLLLLCLLSVSVILLLLFRCGYWVRARINDTRGG